MKKSAIYSVFCAILAFVFLFSSVMTYASWQVQNETINIITTASVRGRIVEEYEQNAVVYPDSRVTKIVQVQNTGSIDALPRVKIEKAWGDSRDADGRLIVNPDLSTDNILITFNTQSWVYRPEDGYFYYKYVLKPGEVSASLFDSFTIDKAATGSEYRNKQADIIVNLEIIQASDEALHYWGTSYEELDIVYRQTEQIELITKVNFNNPEKGFTFDINSGDLFADFKNLIPGEARSQIIDISNLWNDPVRIYFWADYIDQEKADERTMELVYRMLHEYAIILITDEDSNVIYDGPIWGNPDVDSTGTDSMKYPFDLGHFDPGMSKRIHVGLQLDAKMEQEELELLGLIKWVFSAQGDGTTITEPPVSTDTSAQTPPETTASTDSSSVDSSTTAERVSTTASTGITDGTTASQTTSKDVVIVTTDTATTTRNDVATTEMATTTRNDVATTEAVTTTRNDVATTEAVTTTKNIVATTEAVTTTRNDVATTETATTTMKIGIVSTTQVTSTTSGDSDKTETQTTTGTDDMSEMTDQNEPGTTDITETTDETRSSSTGTSLTSDKTTTSSGSESSSVTTTDYPSSPETGDQFRLVLYAVLAAASLLMMPVMYRKAKAASEED